MPWKRLREEREARGVTVDEVADRLKISRKYIRLLESGDLSGLPEPVFVRGYIRTYCQFLGIDSRPFLESYSDFLEERGEKKREPIREVREVTPSRGPSRRTVVGFLSLLLIAGLIVLVVRQVKKEKEVLTQMTHVEAEIARKAPGNPEKKLERMRPGEGVKGGEDARTRVKKGEKVAGTRTEPKVGEAESRATSASSPLKAQEGERRLNLILEAQELTWVFLVVDDGTSKDVTLYPGDRLEVKGEKKIYVKLGNGAGVIVTFNGKRLGALGGKGEVVEKTFTREGEE
ncbi:MAG: helix-turn-helix domain-containing protein [Deltaproteobacteria bacterium]|nr:MAG: helix-turn-helix domain-containing protein [Deltaproteobacteria bacterium]